MINKNDSLLDIAKVVVEESKRPLAISEIVEKVFSIKGVTPSQEEAAQFGIDFMLSGDFICCGANKKENLWDLKSRQSVSLLDKDGGYLDDIHEDDEEVKNNLLTDETIYEEDIDKNLDDNNDDDEETDETDDLAEELGLISEDQDAEDGFGATQEIDVELDDEDEQEENDSEDEDLEDVVEGTFK